MTTMDRINSSSFPINQALRAYAQSPKNTRVGGSPFVKSVQPMRPVAGPSSTNGIERSTGVEQSTRILKPTSPDSVAKIAPQRSALQSSSINELIGAKVQPINLNHDVAKVTGPKPITTSAGTYSMYPHAADRNLAATNIVGNTNLGRSLDLNG